MKGCFRCWEILLPEELVIVMIMDSVYVYDEKEQRVLKYLFYCSTIFNKFQTK